MQDGRVILSERCRNMWTPRLKGTLNAHLKNWNSEQCQKNNGKRADLVEGFSLRRSLLLFYLPF